MQRSEMVNELAAALAKAQAKIKGAVKDSSNLFFKSKYADLAAVVETIREPLSENGLSYVQTTLMDNGVLTLETTLLHSSGQWLSSFLPVKTMKDDPQAMGSAMSYSRRYSLSALVGVPQIDDDGESAMGRSPKVGNVTEMKNNKTTQKGVL